MRKHIARSCSMKLCSISDPRLAGVTLTPPSGRADTQNVFLLFHNLTER